MRFKNTAQRKAVMAKLNLPKIEGWTKYQSRLGEGFINKDRGIIVNHRKVKDGYEILISKPHPEADYRHFASSKEPILLKPIKEKSFEKSRRRLFNYMVFHSDDDVRRIDEEI
jgi:hypothetical protein